MLLWGPVWAFPAPAGAASPSAEVKFLPGLLLPPEPRLLSGRAWLITEGLDPRIYLDERGLKAGVGIEPRGQGFRLQAVGAGAAALIPYRNPAAKFSRTILISRDKGRLPFQCGPHLNVNPKDPDHIVVVMMDYNFPGIASYVSIDGGATWEGPHQLKISRGAITGVGDPVVAFDREGHAYAAHMSLDLKYFLVGRLIGAAAVFNIEVTRSPDGGFSWEETVTASPGFVVTQSLLAEGERPRGEVEVVLQDKPWLTVGPDPQDPDKDIIYLTYTSFIERWQLLWIDEVPVLDLVEEQSVIELVRSEDGGQTWSSPVQVSPRVRIRGKGEVPLRVVQGSQPLVAPDGTLYVAWFDSTDDGVWEGKAEIWVASSQDGGRTFSSPRLATTLLETGFSPRVASFRLWGTGFPQMAAGPEGEIYIAYTSRPPDNPEDEGDVFVVRSFDGGKTWERRVRVNDDDTGRMQFFPAISVAPDGTVHVIWGDMRDDPTELSYHIYWSSSKDRGKTWELNSRVSDFPSNPNFAFPYGRYIGDYFTVKATEDDVYIAWADSRLGQLGTYNQKIGFARKKLLPAPSIFISPPSGPAGRDVTIRGHNFQPDLDIFVEIGGVIVATGRTDEDGTFSLKLFIPVTGEGASTVAVKDISGNVATASFFTEFGFDSFRKELDKIEERLAKMEAASPLPSPGPGAGAETPEESAGTGTGINWLVIALASALGLALAALVLLRLYPRRR